MWAGRPGLSPASGRSTCRPTPLGRGKYGPLWTPQISAGMRPPSLAGPHGGDKGSWLSWSLPCGPHFVSVAQMRKSRLREGPEGEGWSAPMTTPPDPRMSCAGAGLGVGMFLGPDEGLFYPGSPAGANWWFPAPPPRSAGCGVQPQELHFQPAVCIVLLARLPSSQLHPTTSLPNDLCSFLPTSTWELMVTKQGKTPPDPDSGPVPSCDDRQPTPRTESGPGSSVVLGSGRLLASVPQCPHLQNGVVSRRQMRVRDWQGRAGAIPPTAVVMAMARVDAV